MNASVLFTSPVLWLYVLYSENVYLHQVEEAVAQCLNFPNSVVFALRRDSFEFVRFH